jgi:hypothetical protein
MGSVGGVQEQADRTLYQSQQVTSITDKRERWADKDGWVGLPSRRALSSKLCTPPEADLHFTVQTESLDLESMHHYGGIRESSFIPTLIFFACLASTEWAHHSSWIDGPCISFLSWLHA